MILGNNSFLNWLKRKPDFLGIRWSNTGVMWEDWKNIFNLTTTPCEAWYVFISPDEKPVSQPGLDHEEKSTARPALRAQSSSVTIQPLVETFISKIRS